MVCPYSYRSAEVTPKPGETCCQATEGDKPNREAKLRRQGVSSGHSIAAVTVGYYTRS